jgi:DNA-binding NtrC family response regulator
MEAVKKNCRILIADRNPHVRKFLKRELMAEGYQVATAGNYAEVIRCAYADNLVDVIILDPDLPGDLNSNLIKTLRSRLPALPVIIHAFGRDMNHETLAAGDEIFVEKQASSIEQLKTIVRGILRPEQRIPTPCH